MESEFVRLKLFFMDLHSVPRNHLRYISWIAYVIARDPRHGIRESIAVANSPHANYYIQDGIDMGAMMDTNLPVAKVCIWLTHKCVKYNKFISYHLAFICYIYIG